MKFITVRDLRLEPGKVWKLTKKESDLVITSHGKPIAILTGVDEGTLEDELDSLRRSRTIKALDSIHKTSVTAGTDKITTKEIDEEIKAVRKERRR